MPPAPPTPHLTHARLQLHGSLIVSGTLNLLLGGWWLAAHHALPGTVSDLGRALALPGPPAALALPLALLTLALPGTWGWRMGRGLLSAALPLLTWHAWTLPGDLALPAPWTGLLLSAGLVLLGVQQLRQPQHAAAWRSYRALAALGPELGGWRIVRHPTWPAYARHLIAPDGQQVILHVTPGLEKGPQHQVRVTWLSPTEATLRRRAWPASSLLWVSLARGRARYNFEPWPDGLGGTLPATAANLAEHLLDRLPPEARVKVAPARPPARNVDPPTPGQEPRLSPRQVRARGQALLTDVPGMLRYLSEEVTPLTPSTFLIRVAGQGVEVGVWPHPDPPGETHPDFELYRQMSGALHRSAFPRLVWGPLLADAGRLAYTPLPWQVEVHFAQGHVREVLPALTRLTRPPAPPPHEDTRREPPPPPPPSPAARRRAHEVLGVAENATQGEIKSAWRSLAKQYHPDRAATLAPEIKRLAEQRMKEINAAYEELTH